MVNNFRTNCDIISLSFYQIVSLLRIKAREIRSNIHLKTKQRLVCNRLC